MDQEQQNGADQPQQEQSPRSEQPPEQEPRSVQDNIIRSERGPEHTLSVRETAHIFEKQGVPRTERAIIKWLNKNRHGISRYQNSVARFDGFFDDVEYKWFLTLKSVEEVIKEEKQRGLPRAEQRQEQAKPFGPRSAQEEPRTDQQPESRSAQDGEIKELKAKNFDLQVLNKGKDYFIEQMKNERQAMLNTIGDLSKEVGTLETKLLLEPPKDTNTLTPDEPKED